MSDAISTLSNASSVLAEAKAFFEAEKKALEEQLFATTTECEMHKSLAAEARAAQAHAERVATKLLTQFSLVEHIFADVKRQALELGFDPEQALKPTATPVAESEKPNV